MPPTTNRRRHATTQGRPTRPRTATWIAAAVALALITGITAALLTPRSDFSLATGIVATLGATLAAVTAFAATLAAHRPGTPPAPTEPPPPDPSHHPDTTELATADRAVLVRTCIWVRDRVTSKALDDRIGAALHEAGITTLEPAHGVPFDATRHEAGSATDSARPDLDGTIAAVEVPGYADRGGKILRVPVVTVYQPHSRPTQARRDR